MPGIVLVVLTAFGFGVWPLIAKASGANQAWATTVVMAITTVLIAIIQAGKLVQEVPTGKMTLLLLAAGVANAIGMIAYGNFLDGSRFAISAFATAALTLVTVVTAFGGMLFFGEQLTVSKATGVILAIVATWLLTK